MSASVVRKLESTLTFIVTRSTSYFDTISFSPQYTIYLFGWKIWCVLFKEILTVTQTIKINYLRRVKRKYRILLEIYNVYHQWQPHNSHFNLLCKIYIVMFAKNCSLAFLCQLKLLRANHRILDSFIDHNERMVVYVTYIYL